MMTDSVAVILQARYSSSCLPGKVLMDIGGRPILEFIIERVKRSEKVDTIILATTTLESDDELEIIAQKNMIEVIRGSENNL